MEEKEVLNKKGSELENQIVSLEFLFPPDNNIDLSDFVKQVECVYRGLGIPILYGVLSILANKSVLFISGRGSGKTRIIKSIPEYENTISSNWDTFTLGELDSLCAMLSGENSVGINNKRLVFRVEEFSTLSEYHREVFLTICSKICTDGNYSHVTALTPHLRIEECKLTMLVAIQPRLYSMLCNRYTQWDNMSYDRFTKFLLLNPLRQGNTFDMMLTPTLPRKILPNSILQDSVNLDKLINLFKGHVSEGRAPLYARDYAIALARFQGKENVEQEDIETFYKLFSPYLGSFSKLQRRENLEQGITVSSGHMELATEIAKHSEGATKTQLSNSMMVTEDHIGRCANFLIEKGLVRKEDDKYHLSTDLEQFFKWYKESFSEPMSTVQKPKGDQS